MLDSIPDYVNGFFSRANLVDIGILALEGLIYREEVTHLLEDMRWELINVLIHIVVGVVVGDSDYLLVVTAVVYHCDNTDRVGSDERHRLNILSTNQEHIEWVAVIAVCARYKAVIRRVMCRGIQYAIENDKACFLIKLIFLS